MKRILITLLILVLFSNLINAQLSVPRKNNGSLENDKTVNSVMSEAYLKYWNTEAQAKIDSDIDKYRKADAVCTLKDVREGTEVRIEQTSHLFLFGGNIFLFGDLKSKEKNERYENTFGTLFNAATVPFYWKTLEQEQGKPRYETGSSYEYRRPATDPVVNFCESRGINMNGHAIIYGMRKWGQPEWMPEERKEMEPFFESHVRELAKRYKGRVQRWDVVNEPIDQANRGLMPDDYTYKSFLWAMKYFPGNVQFNINDCTMGYDIPTVRRYVEIIRNLIDRGIKIDNAGIQMHIFDTGVLSIAKGDDVFTPEKCYAVLNCMSEAERPIHISEVTVAAPDDTEIGRRIQVEITRNLYRLCFSYPKTMGITWWNLVDGGAASGEPSFSGIYDIELNHKPVYYTLDTLINHEWKTQMTVKTDKSGTIKFRGFKGNYRLIWKNSAGEEQVAEFYLKNDGDGLYL